MNDKEFHKHLNELKDLWLKSFNLTSLEQDYVPKLPKEVKEYIGDLDMKLTQGSFIKLLLRNREEMIAFIKPTIESPNCVLDNGIGILFVKEFVDESKNTYFMSVAKNYNGEWIFASHTRREFANIENELKRSKTIINKGFERSEVAGACDILKSGGEVSKPSHLQIKYTTDQDFGTNPTENIPNPSQKSQILSKQETLINKMLKTQDELNSMPRAKDFTKDFEKDLEQSFNVKIDDEDLKKDDGNKFKKGHIMKTNQILKSHLKDIL